MTFLNRILGHRPQMPSLFKGIFILTMGTALGQLIGVATLPILTRIYSPGEFAVLAVFTAIITAGTPLVTLRYAFAIPLPRPTRIAGGLLAACLSLSFLVAILAGIILYFAREPIFGRLSVPEIIPYWWLLPIGFLCVGIYETLRLWATREKNFTTISQTRIGQNLVAAGLKILLGLAGIKPAGLLIGQVVGQAAGILQLAAGNRFSAFRCMPGVRIRHLSFCLRRYRSFPVYQLPSELMHALSTQIPLLFFAWNYGSVSAGQLALALLVIQVPTTLISQSTREAFYGEISSLGQRRTDQIRDLFHFLLKRLSLLSLLPAVLLLFFANILFTLCFGTSWEDAGTYSRLLLFHFLARFIFTALASPLVLLFEKNWLLPVMNFALIAVMFIVFSVAAHLSLAPSTTALTYGTASGAFYLIYLGIIYRTTLKQT